MQATITLPVMLALVVAILFLRTRLVWSFHLFVISLTFGATAVMLLPMLGGASLLVNHLALLVLVCLALPALRPEVFAQSAAIHALAIALAAYAVLIAIFGPRAFGDGIEVIPMRNAPGGLVPLAPASSNITHTVYFCGSIMLAWLCTALFRSGLGFDRLRGAILVLGALHAAFGIADFLGSQFGLEGMFDVLRNASYGILDQSLNGVQRAAGAFPEPSSYAAFAVPLMVFCGELWVQKGDRLAGCVSIALVAGIILSLSSAGLFGLAVYVIVLVFRLATAMQTPGVFARILALHTAGLAITGLAAALFVVLPDSLSEYGDVLAFVTLDKLETTSAAERSQWAMQGFDLLRQSFGFGVGAGSFRSSSLVTAVIGSFGLVGAIILPLYLLPLLRTIGRSGAELANYRCAAWGAFAALTPQLVVGVTPDPGFQFAIFAGFAMSLRTAPAGVRRLAPAQVAA